MNIRHKMLFDIIEQNTTFKHSDQIIHLFAGGSTQHGARLENSGDLDILGVYLESMRDLTAMRQSSGFVGSTGDQHTRNTSADQDYVFKTLREFAVLAAAGNPTMLGFLFTHSGIEDPFFKHSVWFSHIVPNAALFASKKSGQAFLGYGRAQRDRMTGTRGTGKHGQRDELTIKHGYDSKAAMHMIRMMIEGTEFMNTAKITFPNPEALHLIKIRKGEFTADQILEDFRQREQQLLLAIDSSSLPDTVNTNAVNELLFETHLAGWKQRKEI